MSPGEEFHTVRLPKGWTPAKILRFADAVNAIGQAQRLGDEVRALRRERLELRKVLKRAEPYLHPGAYASRFLLDDIAAALKPKKARRAGKRGTK